MRHEGQKKKLIAQGSKLKAKTINKTDQIDQTDEIDQQSSKLKAQREEFKERAFVVG